MNRASTGPRPGAASLGAALTCFVVCLAGNPAMAHPVFTASLTLEHRSHDVPDGAPTAVMHGGAGFNPAVPFDLVIFLHGYSGCVNVLMRTGRVRCTPSSPVEQGWGLGVAHDRAGANSLLFMPQLAYRRRDGEPGRLREGGFMRDMVREALRAARGQVGGVGLDRVRRIVLAAHSGGYEAAATILEHGSLGPRVKRVVLFDALYGNTSQFSEWVQRSTDHSLVTIYNAGRPAEQSHLLVAAARRTSMRVADQPSSLRTAVRRFNVVAFHTRVAHADIPARYFRDVVRF